MAITRETRLTRWMKARYQPVLRWTLAHRAPVLLGSTAVVSASLMLLPLVGREFIPILEEGALTPGVRLPSVSLESIAIEANTEGDAGISGSASVGQQDRGGPTLPWVPKSRMSDPIVTLPRDTWTTAQTQAGLVDAIRHRGGKFRDLGAHEPTDSGASR